MAPRISPKLLTLVLTLCTVCPWFGSPPPGEARVSRHRTTQADNGAAARAKLNKPPFKNGHYVLGRYMPVNGYHSTAPTVVVVDKGSHYTHALQLQGKRVVRVLTISNGTGRQSRPSPVGRFTVARKRKWPSWIPPKWADPRQKAIHPYNKDRKNPLGVAAITLNKWQIALHGTNRPGSIRKDSSGGCIRHSNKDISKLYGMVRKGTPVYIVNRFRGTVLKQSDFWG